MDESPHTEIASVRAGRRRFDRLMLASLLGAGGCLILSFVPPWGIGSLLGLGWYSLVIAWFAGGSLAMAALYAREVVTMQHEILTLLYLWLTCVTVWAAYFHLEYLTTSVATYGPVVAVPWSLWFSLFYATPCFVAWQALALVLRIGWRHWSARRTVTHSAG